MDLAEEKFALQHWQVLNLRKFTPKSYLTRRTCDPAAAPKEEIYFALRSERRDRRGNAISQHQLAAGLLWSFCL